MAAKLDEGIFYLGQLSPHQNVLFEPVNDPNSRMMTDRSLPNVIEAGNWGLLAKDSIHFLVSVLSNFITNRAMK